MKKAIWAAVAVVVVAGGLYLSQHKKSAPASGEPIKIGLPLALTGYAADWGEGEAKAIHLAYEEYKNRLPDIEFITEDTKTTGQGTVNAVQKLVTSDHVTAVIGPTWADSYQGGYPIITQYKVPSITPSAAFEALEPGTRSEYMFTTWWPEAPEVDVIARDMQKHGYKRVLLFHDADAYNTSLMNLFAKEAPKVAPGYFTFDNVSLPIGTTDFRTEIAKLKANLGSSDAVFVSLSDTASVGPFAKQLKEQGVKAQVYETADAENPDNIQKFPGDFDGIRYGFPGYQDDPAYADLHQRFVAEYGSSAAYGPAFVNAYNAAKALFEVIASGAYTSAQITDGIKNVHTSGIGMKNLSFDESGQVAGAQFVLKTVQNNQFELAQ